MKANTFKLFVLIFVFISIVLPLFPESGIYDRIGIIPEHGFHGAVPEENIDLFSGNLTLRFQDIRLPGPNGFDVVVWRVYNSKIMRDRLPGNVWGMQQEPYSYVGLGWSMHMGRIHSFHSDEPIIEFPDGRWETAYPTTDGYSHMTRDFLKYDKNNYKLYFKDGTVWIFGLEKTLTYLGGGGVPTPEQVRVVTKIENSYGHTINIEYQSGSQPELKKITDSMNRTINFVISNNRLDRIYVKNATGGTVNYYYTVGTFSYGGYYKLTEYDPPELPASTYEYYSGQYDHYELTAVNTGLGGRMEYDHADHTFYYQVQILQTRVVSEKRIRFESSGSFKTWNYTYPNYQSSATGTVTVNGPEYNTYVTYHAYSSSAPWKIGLMKKKWFDDDSYSLEQEWTYQEISYNIWMVLNINMGTIKAPLIQESIVTSKGDAESTEEYLYERSSVKKYGLPTKIKFYGGAGGTTLKNYKTLEYYFETNTTYKNKYMLSYVKNEKIFNSSGSKLKETQTTYYSTTGKYGAIDQIRRWRSGSTFLTWDYTYSSTNPNSITITINLPGTAGTETYKYSYGVQSELKRPGYTEWTRTISSHSSAILTETNQHGGTMSFTYDNLDRITNINMPSGFNDINATWATNNVTITQGGNTVKKYWDGLGRDTGYTESGDSITLYFRKTLDAEGRVKDESKGSTSSSHKYYYQRNAAGNPTQITDPRGKITNISYLDDEKRVTDAENHLTIFYYQGLPGLHTRVKDAKSKYADFTYDGAGRLTQVKYNNSRTQSYAYNGLDQVTSETHPETGTISYVYNSENNLDLKTWDNKTINYDYNSSNQLTRLNAVDEIIDYDYDTKGRVIEISSNKGWTRDQISYNSLGAILNERQNIPGLGNRITSYTYDNNNNLKSITYPNGKSVNYTNNSLNVVETVNFNGKSLVSQVAYAIGKQPKSMTISGNSTTFTASYNSMGFLSSTYLKKGTSTRYRADYGYDDVGNITSLSNTTPALNAGFGYDELYRLTSASYTGGKVYNFAYDIYGNLTTAKENGSTVFSKSYNTKNQINHTSYGYDNRGNMTRAPGFEYVWDRQNRLSTVETDTSTVISNYLYNERGLRLSASRLPSPSITVTSPSEAETWYKGGVYSITWTKQGLMDASAKILLYQGSTQVLEIVNPTANDGLYDWSVPGTLAPGTYAVVVQTTDDSVSGSSPDFIIAEAPTITVTSPNGGESWQVGSSYDITWSTTGNVGNVKIEYSINNGSTWQQIIASTLNDGSHPWTVPENVSDTCRVRISETDGTPSDMSDGVFSIVLVPTIFVTSPNGAENWEVGSTHNITWTTLSTVGNVKIEYSVNSGSTWLEIIASTANDGSHPWTIPDNVSNTCLVRISETDGDPSDVSDAVFSIVPVPEITVTSPNGGENWEVNSQYNITWSFIGIVGNVKIEYSVNNGSTWIEIIASTGNDGTHPWTVPDNVSDNCLVRVSETDGTPSDVSDAVFSIVPIPAITVVSPNGGENWEVASSQTITWSHEGIVGNVKIEYSVNNGSTWTEIIGSTPNDGSHPWDVPDNVSDDCLVRISETDGSPSDASDAVFSIVPIPAITVTAPNGGESWEIGSTFAITWTSEGLVGDVKIEYSTDNGSSWSEIEGSTANDGNYNWTIPNTASDQCLVRVSETDNEPSDESDAVFSIALPSMIKVLSPNGGESWAADSIHDITWATPAGTGDVKIDYSTDNGETWIEIASPTANDSIYSWTVPDTPSDQCLVKVSEHDASGDENPPDISDAVFSITSDTQVCGVTWSTAGYSGSDLFHSVCYGNSLFVAVGAGGVIYTGADGINWSAQSAGTANDFYGIGYGSNLFAAVGESGIIFTSANGIDWLSRTSGTANTLRGITYGSGQFAAVGHSGTILTSADGITWTVRSSGVSTALYGITYGSGQWTAVGAGGTVLTSTNGIDWTLRSTNVTAALYGIAYGENSWVAVGENGTILTSANGIDWTNRTSVVSTGLLSVVYGNGLFIIVGSYGELLTSPEGTAWTSRSSHTSRDLQGIGNGNARFVTVGEQVILYNVCGPGIPTITVTSPDGGEILQVGTVHEITWASSGTVGNVMIEYSTDNGSSWTEIIGSTVNDGSHNWTVPDTPSQECLVRVSETDGNPLDESDTVFEISTTPAPTITVISPNGGESLDVGTTYEITWTSSGTVGDVNIEYSINSGFSWALIVASTANDGSYDWTVPDMPSENCLVRISEDDGDRLPSDVSDGVFSIVSPPGPSDTITVTAPNGRESLTAGSLFEITWTTTGTVGDVMIEYSINNGSSWVTIVSSTANDGSHDWLVPDEPSDMCLVRISEADNSGDEGIWDVSDAEFSIVSTITAAVTVIFPNGGEHLMVDAGYEITWSSKGLSGDVKIEYSTDNGGSWIEITAAAPNDGSYDWTVPDAVSDNCLVRVSGSTQKGENVDDVSDDVFSIAASASLTVTAPNGGESWEVGSSQSVTWTTSGTVGSVKIECSTDNGVSWETVVSAMENIGSCAWDIPDTPSDNCLVRVSAVDGDGEPSDVSDQVFSIVLPPSPILTVTSPNGGERLVVGSDYEITWSFVGTVGDVKIEYSTDNGTSWTEIIASTVNSGSHVWLVPDAVSDNCLVRVSDTDGDPSDVSDAVFSIVPPSPESITVIFPNGGESLDAGLSYDITWSSTGTIDNVNIEYSTDGGTSWAVIVNSTLNDGLYEWLVPEESSDECLVRVSRDVVEGSGDEPVSDVSDSIFSIVSELPDSITVQAPNGGERLYSGSLYMIEWITTGTVGNVRIEYSTDDGNTWGMVVEATSNDGNWEWDVPDSPSISCLVRVSELSGDGDGALADESDGVFEIVSDTTPCGRSWITANYTGSDDFTFVGVGNGQFVAVGKGGKIMTSSNGKSWVAQSSGTGSDLYGVVYGNGVFVAVGANGVILSSTNNGVSWTARDSNTVNDLHGVVYGDNQFVAVGMSGAMAASSNGTDWLVIDAGITNDLFGIAYGGNLFVVVGSNGVIFTSIAGVSWERRYPNTSKVFRGIVYGGGKFLAVGDNGLIASSSSGLNWDVRMSFVSTGFQGVTYGNETFVMVGQDGKILTSADGSEWLLRSSGVRNDLYGAAYYNLKFVVVGSGMILYGACEAEGASLTKSFAGSRGGFSKEPLVAEGKDSNLVDDNSLEMVYNENMEEFSRQKAADSRQFDDETPHGPNQSGYFGSTTSAPSAAIPAADTLINTYYIYSYDGKLLCEYDHNGICVKNYIYIGNRLLAEYHPQTDKYYYHMTDQINSTRVITDDNGNVVYSAAHGPYGQIQKVWTNTYDPKLKYSGKEREGYSELDYFGARYYDHHTYRFNSVDPVINKDEALENPQLWNLYAYCRNNPITFVDPDGRLEYFTFTLNKKPISNLTGSGVSYPAFSGKGSLTNHPLATHWANEGPIPAGLYYIVDRPTGGRLGKLRDYISGKDKWFALFRKDNKIDDETRVIIKSKGGKIRFDVKRDKIRLHAGSFSRGCLTLKNKSDFKELREKLLSTKTGTIPGTKIKYYGTIEVKGDSK